MEAEDEDAEDPPDIKISDAKTAPRSLEKRRQGKSEWAKRWNDSLDLQEIYSYTSVKKLTSDFNFCIRPRGKRPIKRDDTTRPYTLHVGNAPKRYEELGKGLDTRSKTYGNDFCDLDNISPEAVRCIFRPSNMQVKSGDWKSLVEKCRKDPNHNAKPLAKRDQPAETSEMDPRDEELLRQRDQPSSRDQAISKCVEGNYNPVDMLYGRISKEEIAAKTLECKDRLTKAAQPASPNIPPTLPKADSAAYPNPPLKKKPLVGPRVSIADFLVVGTYIDGVTDEQDCREGRHTQRLHNQAQRLPGRVLRSHVAVHGELALLT